MKYKIRFHLGKGKNYKHWQVTSLGEGERKVEYLDPGIHNIVMHDCQLRNVPKIAKKVFATQKRNVCGWVECKKLEITQEAPETGEMLVFDPKIKTNWFGEDGRNLDETKWKMLIARGKRVFRPGLENSTRDGIMSSEETMKHG